MDYNLYVVNQDDCPKIDNPIITKALKCITVNLV